MDKYYTPGKTEMDWYAAKDRIALVKDCGFICDPDAGSGKTARLAQQNSFAMEQKKGARTMARYIDADKALEIFDEWIDTTGVLPKGTSYYYEAQGCIEDTPTEDVAPVRHGRWEKPTKLYPFWDWKCSECGCEEYRQADSKGQYRQMAYCPNCGAKMDGEAWEDAT